MIRAGGGGGQLLDQINNLTVGSKSVIKTLDAAFAYISSRAGIGLSYTMVSGTDIDLSAPTAPGTVALNVGNPEFIATDANAFVNARQGDWLVCWANAGDTILSFYPIDKVISNNTIRAAQGARSTQAAKNFAIFRPIHYNLLLTDAEYDIPPTDYEIPPGLSVGLIGIGQKPVLRGSLGGPGLQSQTWRYRRSNSIYLNNIQIHDAQEFLFNSLLGPPAETGGQFSAMLKLNDIEHINSVSSIGMDLYGSRIWVSNLNSINAGLRSCAGDDVRLINSIFEFDDSTAANANGLIDFGPASLGQTAYPAIARNVKIKTPSDRCCIGIQESSINSVAKEVILHNVDVRNGFGVNYAIRTAFGVQLKFQHSILDGGINFNNTAGAAWMNQVRTSLTAAATVANGAAQTTLINI